MLVPRHGFFENQFTEKYYFKIYSNNLSVYFLGIQLCLLLLLKIHLICSERKFLKINIYELRKHDKFDELLI